MENDIFLTNSKYYKWYIGIIKLAQTRRLPANIYSEKHHIIPRSLGGNNAAENIAILTAKEHYVCHHLLTKMTVGEHKTKMNYALWSMRRSKLSQPRFIPSTRAFEYIRAQIALENRKKFLGKRRSDEIRRKISLAVTGPLNHRYGKVNSMESNAKRSKTMTGMTRSFEYISNMSKQRQGEGNPMYGKNHSKEAREKIGKASTGRTHSESVKLRLSTLARSRPKLKCHHCNKEAEPGSFTRWHGDNCKLRINHAK